MARTNKKVGLGAKLTKRSDATLNKAGGIAFKPDAKTELFLRAASLLPGEDMYYASGKEMMKELSGAVGSVMVEDPEFVLSRSLLPRGHAPQTRASPPHRGVRALCIHDPRFVGE